MDIDPVELQKVPSVLSLTNCAMHFLVLFFIVEATRLSRNWFAICTYDDLQIYATPGGCSCSAAHDQPPGQTDKKLSTNTR